MPDDSSTDARIEVYRAQAQQLRDLAHAARTDAARGQMLKMAAQYEQLASRLVAHEVRNRDG